MNEKRNESNHIDYRDNEFPFDIVSATEVTGMVPTPPLTDDEAEGYQGLFGMRQQVAEVAGKAESPEAKAKRNGGPSACR